MEKTYKPHEFAGLLNVTVRTLQRWDREGKLKAYRTPTDRRFYTHEQYLQCIGESVTTETKGKSVIYARVSNQGQKDGLVKQINFLRDFVNARGVIVDEVIQEVGSGLNYKRKKWNELLQACLDGEIKQIFVSHQDRFVRFGFDWFETFLSSRGTEIVVVNNESLSPQEEMVQDLISIIHVFSCRIYGLRKYIKKIKDDAEC